MTLVAGGAGLQGEPYAFHRVFNPADQPQDYYTSAYAAFYNETLTLLAHQRYAKVAVELGLTSEITYPPSIVSAAHAANSEIAEINATIPLAQLYLNRSTNYLAQGLFTNATDAVNSACAYAATALLNFREFSDVSSLRMEDGGVPAQVYASAESGVGQLVSNTVSRCVSTRTQIQSGLNASEKGFRFTITSPQSTIETGGLVTVYGSLTRNQTGVGGVEAQIYFDGFHLGSAVTGPGGEFNVTLRIPYIYNSTARVLAYAQPSQGFPGAFSNTLTFYVNFTSTHLILEDPPSVLPGFTFPVSGVLESSQGPLPYAPVNVSAFGSYTIIHTNSTGGFAVTLAVPSNASDGVHTIYARFAPEGRLGPSFNATSVYVYRLPIELRVTAGRAYAGFAETVSGWVGVNASPRPVSFTVYVSLPWGSYTVPAGSGGNFSVSLPVPLGFLSGHAMLRVSASSDQPFTAPASDSLTLPVFNPLPYLGAAAVALLAAFEARAAWPGRRRGGREQTPGVNTLHESAATPATGRPSLPAPLSIAEVYARAVAAVAASAAVSIQPSLTMRETLASLVDTGAGARVARELELLTRLAEEDAYSRVSSASVDEASEILGRITSTLGRAEGGEA